jgi:hypothetical protein
MIDEAPYAHSTVKIFHQTFDIFVDDPASPCRMVEARDDFGRFILRYKDGERREWWPNPRLRDYELVCLAPLMNYMSHVRFTSGVARLPYVKDLKVERVWIADGARKVNRK